ncbi:MAG: tRNA (guanosine-2'-O-)-methyltransferase [Flavobacteriales bacterium]|jgi:tRNA (guanosine-2'-O-)-methyltransferase
MDLEFLKRECAYIADSFTDERIAGMEKVLADRSNFFTVVLENLYQPHNASAMLRTCDCFGVQRAHIVNDKNEFLVQEKIARGADQWVETYEHKSSETCIQQLKDEGYLIATTALEDYDYTLEEMPLNQKTAIVFGTEWNGTSDVAKKMADIKVKVPMYGFTQSFNVSVSAAIILHHLNAKLRQSNISWRLTSQEETIARHYWYTKISEIRLKE